MSYTQAEFEAWVLGRWLCEECYGRNIYREFVHGIYSRISTTCSLNTKITLNFGRNTLELVSRNVTKNTLYERDVFNNHGYIIGAPDDNQYIRLFSGFPEVNECWGEIIDTYDGSYTISNSFKNTQLYYADLRSDIVVFYSESGEYTAAGKGNEPVGFKTVYADFGTGSGCKTIWIFDAVPIELTITATGYRDENILPNGFRPYYKDTSGTSTFIVAATDRSGYCGYLNGYGCHSFGSYAVIDTSEPYSCSAGYYTELIKPDPIEDMINSWDSFGIFRQMDDYDREIWWNYTQGWWDGIDHGYQDGTSTYDYSLPIEVLPKGSFVRDNSGNYFYSMITNGNAAFNQTTVGDPYSLSGIPQRTVNNGLSTTNLVFYPVAPA